MTTHAWGSVTQTLCGREAFRIIGSHVAMSSGPILRVTDRPESVTCQDCLARMASPQ